MALGPDRTKLWHPLGAPDAFLVQVVLRKFSIAVRVFTKKKKIDACRASPFFVHARVTDAY